MPYTLESGRLIVGPSGLKLATLHRVEIPEREHPDGASGAYTISPYEADRFAHQIVDALNADPRRPDLRHPAPDLAGAVRAYLAGTPAPHSRKGFALRDAMRAALDAASVKYDGRHAFEVVRIEQARESVVAWFPCDLAGADSAYDAAELRAASERTALRGAVFVREANADE